ncbi:DsrE family protein [Lapidilactobacillus wuchangensis]|uniref:DsrE family protein n=1 Tax=Lapidilactobacillus wuchangensis TaxID=2486001 RepID=UPI000F771688|nr:DsrE family protein [Lapidilactobacillus wuchangensis]
MVKVVIHVDEAVKVQLAIGNVQNLLAALPTSEVIVVVNGPAITTLPAGAWANLLKQLPQVELDACHNAMVSHQITATDLPAGVTVVAAGVVRIVELQGQGFAYLKP